MKLVLHHQAGITMRNPAFNDKHSLRIDVSIRRDDAQTLASHSHVRCRCRAGADWTLSISGAKSTLATALLVLCRAASATPGVCFCVELSSRALQTTEHCVKES